MSDVKSGDTMLSMNTGICVQFLDGKIIVDRDCTHAQFKLTDSEIIPPIEKWSEIDGSYYDIGKMIVDYLVGISNE